MVYKKYRELLNKKLTHHLINIYFAALKVGQTHQSSEKFVGLIAILLVVFISWDQCRMSLKCARALNHHILIDKNKDIIILSYFQL